MASTQKLPAVLAGIGMGGFVDGILLHEVLQWHHMVSDTSGSPTSTVSGLEDNVLADGLFHVATWLCVATAMVLTVQAWQRGELAPPWRRHAGLVLAGWGAFNVVEGLIDHELLGVHHVRDDLGGPVGWDLAFLAFGAMQVLAGLALARSARVDGRPAGPALGSG